MWTSFGGDSGNNPSGESGDRSGFGGRGNFPIWAISQCPLAYGDLLIVLSQAPEAGAVTYHKKTGEIIWKTKRDPDFNKGSMIYANGLILATDEAKKLYLIEPDPAGFKSIASSELLGEPKTQAEGIAARVGGSTQN